MYQGTYHYVQRLIGEIETQPTEEHPEHEVTQVWEDVRFEDNTVWRSRRFVTAANHVDALHAQELANGAELEQYRVVKRTFQEEVITPRWRYIEFLSGADGEVWERITFGEQGAVWRCRSFGVAQDEIAKRLKPLAADAKFRMIHPDGYVEHTYSRSDFEHSYADYESDDVFADDEEEDLESTQPLDDVPQFEVVEEPEVAKPEYLHYENPDGTIGKMEL